MGALQELEALPNFPLPDPHTLKDDPDYLNTVKRARDRLAHVNQPGDTKVILRRAYDETLTLLRIPQLNRSGVPSQETLNRRLSQHFEKLETEKKMVGCICTIGSNFLFLLQCCDLASDIDWLRGFFKNLTKTKETVKPSHMADWFTHWVEQVLGSVEAFIESRMQTQQANHENVKTSARLAEKRKQPDSPTESSQRLVTPGLPNAPPLGVLHAPPPAVTHAPHHGAPHTHPAPLGVVHAPPGPSASAPIAHKQPEEVFDPQKMVRIPYETFNHLLKYYSEYLELQEKIEDGRITLIENNKTNSNKK